MHNFAGITQAVLLPATNPESVHTIQSNEQILEVWQHYPDRFIPFCNIDPRQCSNTPEADLGYMLAYYKDLGCRGIGEVTSNLYFDDPRVENLFDHVEKTDLPLTFHVAPNEGGTYGLIDSFGLPRFEQQVQKHPDLVWLCHSQGWWSHISGDVTEETRAGYPEGKVVEGVRVVELMRKYPNVCGDLSAGSGLNALTRDPEFAYWFLTEFQDRLCFGTDACTPKSRRSLLIGLRDFLDEALAGKHISQEVYDKVTYQNAQRILQLN